MPITKEIDIKGGFVIMMAGNIADGIGLPYLIPVLEKFKDNPSVTFVFVGGGALEQDFRTIVKNKKLENVLLTGQVPFSEIPSYYCKADAMLLTLKKTDLPHLKATIPGRLQSYMSAGKPVIAMIDEGASQLIKTADYHRADPVQHSNSDYHGVYNYDPQRGFGQAEQRYRG